MRQIIFLLALISSTTVVTVESFSQVPSLPDGAQTHWIVDQPKEIVSWILFDPTTVENRLPSTLQFTTVGELASTGIGWAVDYLSENPDKKTWGISFLEIIKTGTFTIDGVAPEWPEKGAAALWFARVTPANPQDDPKPGGSYLALNFWIPDSLFAVTMREKGHYATFGNVTLYQNEDGWWKGVIDTDDLNVVGNCLPTEPIYGGSQSAGMQKIFPPNASGVSAVVRIAFAGHRIQYCKDSSTWTINGSHALSNGVILEPFEFQFGYDMKGGAYQR
ncbi:MAG TPA: hypothetical protein VJ951_02675 [Bacteroidales bacterium]|nr:hypothetical protein [Bacteroidales bacterium]